MAKSRSPRTTLFRFLEESQQPVFIINREREIVFANAACGDWLSCEVEELVGATTAWHSDADATSIAGKVAALCPSPELFSGQKRTASLLVQPNAQNEPCVVTFHAIDSLPTKTKESDETTCDELAGIIGIVDPKSHSLDPVIDRTSEVATRLHAALRSLGKIDPNEFNRDLEVGQDSWIEQVKIQTRVASRSGCNVLISGEAGSGRRELAEKIHAIGARKKDSTWLSQLIPIDCPRLEPFSLQKLFTETVEQVRTLDEKNVPCFLMLDIDQLDANSQIELSGLNQLQGLRFRLIGISGRDKSQLLASEDFNDSLARELATVEIAVPPLRNRRDDIPLLAQLFLEDHNAKSQKQMAGFTTEALDELSAYDWPGNIVQFEQFVEESCERAAGDFVTASELPKRIKLATDAAAYPNKEFETIDLDAFLGEIEQELIGRALRAARGNKTKAAKLLGITRARLHRKMGEAEFVDLNWDVDDQQPQDKAQ